MQKEGGEEFLQLMAKYSLMCRSLGITPLSLREMSDLRVDALTMIGTASTEMLKENIWSKKA